MNLTKNNNPIKRTIQNKAIDLGFASIGVAEPNLSTMASDNLGLYLSNDWHGDMNWMLINGLKRKKPKHLWPDVKSIIVLTMSYSTNQSPLESLNHKNHGVISTYAKGDDYHIILKKRLKQFSDWLVNEYSCNCRIFVDTAPVMEKSIAESSGIGWQGKHTNILSREFGNWLLIGSIFTTLDLESDKISSNHCGKCNACQTICPTDAFIDEYKLDS